MLEELLNKIDEHVHWEITNPEANDAFNRLKKELVEIKKPSNNKQSTKPCPWCNGKVYRFNGVNYQDDCVVCKGSGWVNASYIC